MKVALYARVSTEEQRKKDSVESQLIHLRKYADTYGHNVIAEYVDDGRSGSTIANRPAYIQMMKDAERHKFDAIVGFKLDRFHRKTVNALLFVDSLRMMSISLIITSQHIDTSTAMGTAMMQITAVFAELETANTIERSKIGTERAKNAGKICNRPRVELSSYQIDKARNILNENPDISMRELSRNFEGISRPTLVKALKENGVVLK